MKRILSIWITVCVLAAISAHAQNIYKLSAPKGYYTTGSFPVWYGKADTVVTTGTDTFKVNLRRGWTTNYNTNNINSITFSNDMWKVGGSPTVTVACYASANNGASYGNAAITTYTVSPTSTSVPLTNTQIINSGSGGNPYTDYMWVITGSASSTASWQGTVLLR